MRTIKSVRKKPEPSKPARRREVWRIEDMTFVVRKANSFDPEYIIARIHVNGDSIREALGGRTDEDSIRSVAHELADNQLDGMIDAGEVKEGDIYDVVPIA